MNHPHHIRSFTCLAVVLILACAPVSRTPAAPDAPRDPGAEDKSDSEPYPVTAVPDAQRQRLNLAPFYAKYVSVRGFPVVASAKASDYALREAAFLIDRMLAHHPKALRALIDNKVRFTVMACTEMTTDVPEHADLTPRAFWDRRARGLGATRRRPSVSCGEENLLHFPGDPYRTENILIHEFAHAVHQMGVNTIDKTFDARLRAAYDDAMKKGLWKDKYAANNKSEYFAEGVQSWFDTNRENDHDHNHVNTRQELIDYDPALAKLCEEVFGNGPWRYQRIPDRKDEKDLLHLKGYDAGKAPRFEWPQRVKDVDVRKTPE